MKKILIAIIFTFFTVLTGTAIYHYITIHNNPLLNDELKACTTRLVYLQDNHRLNLILTFVDEPGDNTGSVFMEGVYSVDDLHNETINRQIYFDYTRNKNSYTFTSTGIRSLKGETITGEKAQTILPDFYAITGAKVTYSLLPHKGKGIIFTIGKIPRFYCEKVDD